jgi:hypothetical protein
MVKTLLKSTATVNIKEKTSTPKLLIEDILSGRNKGYTYEVIIVTDDTLIFNFTYDDWDFKVPVVCQLIADTYWVVTK